jgi:hypothetical protein
VTEVPVTVAPLAGDESTGAGGATSVKPSCTTQPSGLLSQFTSHQMYEVPCSCLWAVDYRSEGAVRLGAERWCAGRYRLLSHPTHDRLVALGLVGMAKAFEEQRQQSAVASLTFEERLGLLVDREAVERESKRLVARLKFANLRPRPRAVSIRRCLPSSQLATGSGGDRTS